MGTDSILTIETGICALNVSKAVPTRKANAKMFNAIKNYRSDYVIRLYHAHEINVNLRDSDGNSLLHWAGATRQNKLIQFLIRKGADKSAMNNKQESVSDVIRNPKLLIDDNKEN